MDIFLVCLIFFALIQSGFTSPAITFDISNLGGSLDEYLEKKLKEFSRRMEEAALEIQESHKTLHRLRRSVTVMPEDLFHSYVYGTGAGNRERLVVEGVDNVFSINATSTTSLDRSTCFTFAEKSVVLVSSFDDESYIYQLNANLSDVEFTTPLNIYPGITDIYSFHAGATGERYVVMATGSEVIVKRVSVDNAKIKLDELVQSLQLEGVVSMSYKEVETGKGYLVMARPYESHNYLCLFSTMGYTHTQVVAEFPSNGTSKIELVLIHKTLLAVACNRGSTGNVDADSVVYVFDGSTNTFTDYQRIPAKQCIDVAHVIIGLKHHLFIVQGEGPLIVFKWNGYRFVEHQQIEIAGARSVKAAFNPDYGWNEEVAVLVQYNSSVAVLIRTVDAVKNSFVISEKQDLDVVGTIPQFSVCNFKSHVYLPFTNGVSLVNVYTLLANVVEVPDPVMVQALDVKKNVDKAIEKTQQHELNINLTRTIFDDALKDNSSQIITGNLTILKPVIINRELKASNLSVAGGKMIVDGRNETLNISEYAFSLEELTEQLNNQLAAINETDLRLQDAFLLNATWQNATSNITFEDRPKMFYNLHTHHLFTSEINNVSMSKLNSEVVRDDRLSRNITGPKIFQGNLYVDGNVNIIGKVYGDNVSSADAISFGEEVVTKSGSQVLTGVNKFSKHTTVNGDADVGGYVNGIDVGKDVIKLDADYYFITGKKVFKHLIVENFTAVGLFNGHNITNMDKKILRKSGGQVVTNATLHFQQTVIAKYVNLNGLLNKLNLTDILSRAIFIDEDAVFPTKCHFGDVEIYGDIIVLGFAKLAGHDINDYMTTSTPQAITASNKFLGNVTIAEAVTVAPGKTVEYVDLSEDAITLTGNDTIDFPVTFTGPVTIWGNLDMAELKTVQSVDISEFDKIVFKLSTEQNVTGAFVFFDDVFFASDVSSYKINGFDLSAVYNDTILLSDSSALITGHKSFLDMTVEGNVVLGGTVNEYNITQDFLDNFSDQVADGYYVFTNSVTITEIARVDTYVDGVDIEDLNATCLTIYGEQIIGGNKNFTLPVEIKGNLAIIEDLNGIDIGTDPVRRLAPQPILGEITFVNELVVANLSVLQSVNLSGKVDNVDISFFAANRLSRSGNEVLDSQVTFTKLVIIDGSLLLAGLLDGEDIVSYASDVLFKFGDQTVTGLSNFTGTVTVNGSLTAVNGFNNVSIEQLADDAAFRDVETTIEAETLFVDTITVHENLTAASVDTVDLAELKNDVVYLVPESDQEITGETVSNTTIFITHDLNATLVNGLHVHEDLLTKNTEQTLYGNYTVNENVTADKITMDDASRVSDTDISHLYNNSMKTNQNNIVTHLINFENDIFLVGDLILGDDALINGEDIQAKFNDAIYVNQNASIEANKTFTSGISFEGNLNTLNGTVNGKVLSELKADMVHYDKAAKFTANQTFADSTTFEALIVDNNMVVEGNVNNVDVDQYFDTAVFIHKNHTISNTKQFLGDLEVVGDVQVEDAVNTIRLQESVITLTGATNITGNKTFDMLNVTGNIDLISSSGTVNGYDIKSTSANTLNKAGNHSTNGTYVFSEAVIFKGNVDFLGETDGINNLSGQTILLDSNITINDNKTFTSDINAMDALTLVSGKLLGQDFAALAENIAYTDEALNVTGEWTFVNHVIMNDTVDAKIMDGVNVKSLNESVYNLDEFLASEVPKVQQSVADQCNRVANYSNLLNESVSFLQYFEHFTTLPAAHNFETVTIDGNKYLYQSYGVPGQCRNTKRYVWLHGDLVDAGFAEFNTGASTKVHAFTYRGRQLLIVIDNGLDCEGIKGTTVVDTNGNLHGFLTNATVTDVDTFFIGDELNIVIGVEDDNASSSVMFFNESSGLYEVKQIINFNKITAVDAAAFNGDYFLVFACEIPEKEDHHSLLFKFDHQTKQFVSVHLNEADTHLYKDVIHYVLDGELCFFFSTCLNPESELHVLILKYDQAEDHFEVKFKIDYSDAVDLEIFEYGPKPDIFLAIVKKNQLVTILPYLGAAGFINGVDIAIPDAHAVHVSKHDDMVSLIVSTPDSSMHSEVYNAVISGNYEGSSHLNCPAL